AVRSGIYNVHNMYCGSREGYLFIRATIIAFEYFLAGAGGSLISDFHTSINTHPVRTRYSLCRVRHRVITCATLIRIVIEPNEWVHFIIALDTRWLWLWLLWGGAIRYASDLFIALDIDVGHPPPFTAGGLQFSPPVVSIAQICDFITCCLALGWMRSF